MWFRRLFRRRREPPPLLLPSLDRLGELIERVVALLDEVSLAPEPVPVPLPAPAEELVVQEHKVEQPAAGWLAFVHAPDGYRLLERDGAAPELGASVALEEGLFRVLRVGPSPLPGDRRRCAFVEQEQRPAARTSDG